MKFSEYVGAYFYPQGLWSAVTLFLLLGVGITGIAQTEIKLAPNDIFAEDEFGTALAIEESTLVIGAPKDDDNGSGSGSVYIFLPGGGGSWQESAKLLAADGSRGDWFGRAVAVNGADIIVGAPRDSGRAHLSGSAYIFHRDSTGWHQQARLIPDDGAEGDFFGWSVDIGDGVALVGAFKHDHSGFPDAGAAYVFVRQGTTWVQQARLIANDADMGDYFGWSVAIDGDEALVGAHLDDVGTSDAAGAVYVFRRQGNVWQLRQKLVADDREEDDAFGYSVDIDGEYAVIGAPEPMENTGSAYIFFRQDSLWIQQQKLTVAQADTGDQFGFAVSIDSIFVLIGSPYRENNGVASGAAYRFRRQGFSWFEETRIVAGDGAAGDLFGSAVAVAGDLALVGAPHNDEHGNEAGAAYLYFDFMPGAFPPFVARPIPDQEVAEDFLPYIVADLDTVFDDIDSPVLTYRVATDGNTIAQLQGSLLELSPVPNFFGLSRVQVTAIDEQPDSVVDEFLVQVLGVNDPPQSFDLIFPANGDTVQGAADSVRFIWQAARDVDGDTLEYLLHLYGPGMDTVLIHLQDTSRLFLTGNRLLPDSAYFWSVRATDGQDTVASRDTFRFVVPRALGLPSGDASLPTELQLLPNHPNPFNPSTKIPYTLPHRARVQIRIYDVTGRLVRRLVDEIQPAGKFVVVWDGRDALGKPVASGLYIYVLRSDGRLLARRMLLLK